MIIILIISLYTSRVVLSTLGADDFGIYNVVGGIVVLFSFLTTSMTSSTQRFLNYYLGLNDDKKTAKVFNAAIYAHLTIFILVLLLSETIGLWFVCTQLNIPSDRNTAMIWVYQMSVLTTLMNIMVIPYRGAIIATEKMSIFAYLSIFETALKLIIVLLLQYIKTDRLIMYVILLCLVSIINLIIYIIICNNKFIFCKFHFSIDKKQYKDQMSFSVWYLFGGLSLVAAKQGANILINIFFNVTVNAAVGIANQVRSAIYGFITSFQTAFNPQIVKLYAINEYEKLLNLIYRSSKFSYFLLFILSFPVILFCEDILSIWLVEVPDYTVSFTQFVLLISFTEALSAPLWTAIGATGNVKWYQIIVSIIILFDIPFVYVAFKLGFNPTFAFIINLIISIIAYIYRLIYIKKYVKYNLSAYFNNVIVPCIKVTVISLPIPLILRFYNESLFSTILYVITTIIISIISIYIIGLDKVERTFINSEIKNRFRKNIL